MTSLTATAASNDIELGHCLQRARCIAGMNIRSAARQLGVRSAKLRSWEAGESTPGTDDIERAILVYGTDLQRIWPDRQPLVESTEPGVLIVGDERIPTTGANREILTAYLDAVRRQRQVAPGTVVELRADDVSTLAGVLDLDDESLESLLVELFDLTPAGAKLTMRALAVGVLGTIALATVLGSTWLVSTASADASAAGAGPAAQPVATASPFTTEPVTNGDDAIAEVELAPAVFAVAPATEWSPVVPDESVLAPFDPPELISADQVEVIPPAEAVNPDAPAD